MESKTSVITIGYGRHMFDAANSERLRLEECAAEVGALHLIIFTKQSDELSVTIGKNNLVIYPTNSRHKGRMLFDAYRIAARILKKVSQPGLVTTQDPFETGLVGFALKKRFGVHLTVQEHADVFSHSYWKRESVINGIRYYLGLFILKKADTVRVVSARIKNTLNKMQLSANLTQLPVAVDVRPFTQAALYVSGAVVPAETFTFLTVARFVEQKNLMVLLQAFHTCWQNNSQLRLQIVGRGPQETLITQFLQQHYSLIPRADVPVSVLGWSDDVPTLMTQADAYVLSSNYEGWARVLIEAMSVGLPAVTTDVGCVGEVFFDSVHGLVVPPNDAAALSAAMQGMATNTTQYQTFRQNLQNLDIQKIVGTDFSHYGTQWAQALR